LNPSGVGAIGVWNGNQYVECAHIRQISVQIGVVQLRAVGAVSTGNYFVTNLPGGASVLGVELFVNNALTATGLSNALGSVQSSSDSSIGTLLSNAVVTSTGYKRPDGTNPYIFRSGHQINLNVVITGATLNNLTNGTITTNVYFCVPLQM
jgi:hypothetical protein